MTSIEFLVEELYNKMNMSGDGRVLDEILKEAKEMHKAEIIAAYMDRMDCTDKEVFAKIIGEQYYQKTFKQE